MPTHHGKSGVIRVGSNAIAEVQDWTVETTVTTADDTAMGDTDESHLVGIKSWQGTLKCSWDPSDTNGQQLLVAGAQPSLEMYGAGTGAGAEKLSGTATITKVVRTINRGAVVERSFDFKGNGALTETTV